MSEEELLGNERLPQRSAARVVERVEDGAAHVVSSARRTAESLPPWARRVLAVTHIDFDPPGFRLPVGRLAIATLVAVVGSLAADAMLVAVGTSLFPSTVGYSHFVPADYALLTVVGVVGTCAAWPLVRWVTSMPRWVFLRAAILVTAVLLLPDVYIYALGQNGRAVAILVVMHLAIAVITYYSLVQIAPAEA